MNNEINKEALLYQKILPNSGTLESRTALALLNHFLKRHQQPSAGRGDLNFIVKDGPNVIGCARLLPLAHNTSTRFAENNFWLRGVFVTPQYRHQGIASALLQFMHQQLEQADLSAHTIYAFPYEHLQSFYQPLGYELCETERLPVSLRQRFEQACQQNKKWLCMMRQTRIE
ncbi:GNAT family N-acetyltransferase [Thiomicrorhabdus sp. zzn3]|uniref:GNAT family N-acetyltransferase n=1 Tax=Thiomicrorhabdus sp. zzn3 TaxID=3039775 RepID=UPI00243646FE|nr:GNAT family N-acetyltransferase [Thiomicrorhabdus sp. zzn3]MDG6778569.1 GNAT family N-acetyltransferase [Thiomicrorhabdus sp. zzn3]